MDGKTEASRDMKKYSFSLVAQDVAERYTKEFFEKERCRKLSKAMLLMLVKEFWMIKMIKIFFIKGIILQIKLNQI